MQMPTVARGVERASLNLRSEHEQEQAMRGPGGVSGLRRPAPPARCDKLHVAQEHHIGSVKGSPDRRQTADLEFAYEVGLGMRDFGRERFGPHMPQYPLLGGVRRRRCPLRRGGAAVQVAEEALPRPLPQGARGPRLRPLITRARAVLLQPPPRHSRRDPLAPQPRSRPPCLARTASTPCASALCLVRFSPPAGLDSLLRADLNDLCSRILRGLRHFQPAGRLENRERPRCRSHCLCAR